jgi:argininosuccinate lyase
MRTEAKNSRDLNYAEFSGTFRFDKRLFFAALRVNLAYCDALFQAGVLTRLESERVKNGLQTIHKRAEFNQNYFDEQAADVHSFIETRLVGLVGETGEKINIGINRFDQTATAFRLCLREEIEQISKLAKNVQTAFIEAGERQRESILPSFAHSLKAQPVLWAHWCLAYYEMFSRDRERLDEVWRRVNVLPLGAADAAGTAVEIDREEIARALGFEGVSVNSLDTVSDADYAIESIGALSLLAIHISRLAEDLILFGSAEVGFIRFSNSGSGSTDLQPLKKTFEVLELIRGKTGKIFGHQTALQTTVKNLRLGMHKDLLETLEPVFDSVDTVKICLRIAAAALQNLRVDEAKTLAAAKSDYLNSTELADYLVQRNVSLKAAQSAVEEIVSFAVSQNKKLDELSLDEFRKFSANVEQDVFEAISLEQSLASKNQIGGTSPERVFEALEQARENLEREKDEAGN